LDGGLLRALLRGGGRVSLHNHLVRLAHLYLMKILNPANLGLELFHLGC
jgi:hypothetical protein